MTGMGIKAAVGIVGLTSVMLFYEEMLTAGRELADKAREVVTSAELIQFDRSLLAFWDMRGGPPKNIKRYLTQEFDFSDPRRRSFLDHWGHPYVFQRNKQGYKISSKGSDGNPGTQDDLYIQRRGDRLKSHLTWAKDPKPLVAPFQEASKKLQKDLEKKNLSGSHPQNP